MGGAVARAQAGHRSRSLGPAAAFTWISNSPRALAMLLPGGPATHPNSRTDDPKSARLPPKVGNPNDRTREWAGFGTPRAPARARLSLLPSGPGEVHGVGAARGVDGRAYSGGELG